MFSQAKYGAGGAVRASCLIWCNYHHHSIPSQDLCLLMIKSREIPACLDKSLVHTAVRWRNRFSKNVYFAIIYSSSCFFFSEELKRRMSNSFSCNKNGCTAKLQKGPKNIIKLVGTTRDFELIEFKGLCILSPTFWNAFFLFSYSSSFPISKCLLWMWKRRKSNLIQFFLWRTKVSGAVYKRDWQHEVVFFFFMCKHLWWEFRTV